MPQTAATPGPEEGSPAPSEPTSLAIRAYEAAIEDAKMNSTADAGELCAICAVDYLGQAPAVMLGQPVRSPHRRSAVSLVRPLCLLTIVRVLLRNTSQTAVT